MNVPAPTGGAREGYSSKNHGSSRLHDTGRRIRHQANADAGEWDHEVFRSLNVTVRPPIGLRIDIPASVVCRPRAKNFFPRSAYRSIVKIHVLTRLVALIAG